MANRVKKQISEAELAEEIKKYILQLEQKLKTDDSTVKKEARTALIHTGVLTKSGTAKKKIVSWE